MNLLFSRSGVIVLFLLSLCFSCSKQEPLDTDPPHVINLMIMGSTTEDLEFIYKDSVIALGVANNGQPFSFTTKLNAGNEGEVLKIRKKGSADILETRTIPRSPYDQTVKVYYDGSKIYTSSVAYQIKGYAMSGEIEFLLDGKVIASGTGIINNTISFGMDENSTREIQVRQKGETTYLLTKTIASSPIQQSLKFFFDGIAIVDNVQLNPPVNPANMSITAQFKTTVPDMFLGGQVDVVFYMHNIVTGVYSKPSPEIRMTMPADGSFANIELPALPNGTDYDYRMVIYKKGTKDQPYDASSSGFPIILENDGRYSSQLLFVAGQSNIWLINDSWSLDVTPDFELASYFGIGATDLSQYFQ
jgi:hypothetical protein